ncbi:MAG: PleD family two-component system response regulator [Anaerolineales bacterium]
MIKNLALIIEDDPQLSIIFSEALVLAGYEVKAITDGQVALEVLKTSAPALVVLDLHLPRVAGEEILNWIKANTRLANTHIMVATADARKARELRGKADLVLVKPIRFGQLRDLAARLKRD